MRPTDLVSPDSVCASLKATTKKHLLQELSDKAAKICGLPAREIFDALLHRERVERELFLHLAHHGRLGCFRLLEETRDEAEHLLRPVAVAREDHAALVLHDRRHHRHRVVPVHEAARARQAPRAAVLALCEGLRAAGAEPKCAAQPRPSPTRAPREASPARCRRPAPCPAGRRPCRPPAALRSSRARPPSPSP